MKISEAVRASAAVLVLALAAGCGRDDGKDAPAEGGTPESGGTAVIAEQADINLPLSVLANTQLDGDLAADVLNVALVRGSFEDGEVVFSTADQSPMALARRYEFLAPDSTALRFHMRSDGRWSDGRPITASDFVYTYELARDPKLASGRQDHTENLDSVVAHNDSTITFFYKQRNAEMLSHASLPPTPRHLFEGTAPERIRTHPAMLDPSGGKLVTSGPWVIGRWQKGQQVVLTPNPHFRPQPHLAQIVFRIIPEPTTRVVELQTGNVDMLKGIPHAQIPTVQAQPGVRLERERARAYEYVAYNPAGFAPFADLDVRRALTLAIDTERLIQGVHSSGYATPAGGPFPPILKVYDASATPPVRADPQQARQLLESKGWRDTDGDGVLDKDGQPFRFTLITNGSSQRRSDGAEVIQQMWKQIGVDAQIRSVEYNTLMESMIGKKYQASLGGWNSGLSPDAITLFYRSDAPYNITGYNNPQVDALMDQAMAAPTAEAALPLWRRAVATAVRDQPYTWLYYYDSVDPIRDRLRNVRVDSWGPYQNTWEWWIPRSQQRASGGARPDSAR